MTFVGAVLTAGSISKIGGRMDRNMEMSLKDIYQNNDRFRRYVDRSAENYKITVNEVFSQAMTREVAQSYMDEEA